MGRRATFKPRPRMSLAKRLRRHRLAFELALELGCTPKEAEAEIDRREARKVWEQARDRLEAKKNENPLKPAFDDWQAPWMLRD